MKILVVDDKKENREAAMAQLKEHNLTVVGSQEEAEKLLNKENHGFEVVLLDLLMPAGKRALSKNLIGIESDSGVYLALLAAVNGAKYVGVLTDASHHNHPSSACIDLLMAHPWELKEIKVADSKLFLSNDMELVKSSCKEDLTKNCDKCDQKNWECGKAYLCCKDWKSFLDQILQH